MKLNLNYKKTGLISLASFIFAIVNGYFLFPKILQFMLKRNLQLRPGSQMRPLFEKIPFPLVFKIHIFNITNPDDILQGSKPVVNDIGPYIFNEWKERDELKDDEFHDTISYNMKNRFVFRPDLSKGLTGEEIVTVPNLIIFGGIMGVKRDRAPMLPLVTKAMKSIFNDPKTPFQTVKVMDFLFNGIEFDCDGPDFSVGAVCAAIKTEAQGVKVIKNNLLSVSLLGHKNNTNIGRFTISRGIKDIKDLGRIMTFNNDRIQSVWDGDKCNRFEGTDSTIFPPFLKPEEGLWTFTPDICMSLKAHFEKKSSYAGLPTRFYTIDFGDFRHQPDKQCFCSDPPDDCPPKGTLDLMPCIGGPIFGSKPHFLDADPELLEKVDGLNPSRSLHDVFVNFEPISGTPLEGYKRLQFSIEMGPVEEFEMMNHLPDALLPLVWVEEGVALNKTYTNLLKYQLFLAKKINTAVKWIGIIGGLIGAVASAFMIYREHSKKATISAVPVKPANNPLDSIKYIEDKSEVPVEGATGNI